MRKILAALLVALVTVVLTATPAEAKRATCVTWSDIDHATPVGATRYQVEQRLGVKGWLILNGSRDLGPFAPDLYPRSYVWVAYPACNQYAEATIVYRDRVWQFATVIITRTY